MMAFFDELGKKISDASQGVVQKTKDTAETLKLNSAISDEEKKIKTLFTALGEAYFASHADNCEEQPLKNLIGQISDSKQKISDLQEQVKRLKGVVKCPYCGGEINYGSTFCNFCGKNVENFVSEKKEGTAFCTNCGTALEAGAAFCTSCGTPVESAPEQEPATEEAPVAEEAAAQEPAVEETSEETTAPVNVFCTSCGTKLQPDDKFCTTCGAKVEN